MPDVNVVLQHVRLVLYLLAAVISLGLSMQLGTLRHRLAQWLSVVFGCWALNASVWWAILRHWVSTGSVPPWHQWGATVNAVFLFAAPVAIWSLFRWAMDGDR